MGDMGTNHENGPVSSVDQIAEAMGPAAVASVARMTEVWGAYKLGDYQRAMKLLNIIAGDMGVPVKPAEHMPDFGRHVTREEAERDFVTAFSRLGANGLHEKYGTEAFYNGLLATNMALEIDIDSPQAKGMKVVYEGMVNQNTN